MPQDSPLKLRPADILLYNFLDDLSGLLLCLMVVFSPWAFGSTVPWARWTVNIEAYLLAALLLVKLLIRAFRGYAAPRFRDPTGGRFTLGLAILSILLLLYILVSAINARATFIRTDFRFEYHEALRWLPHSLDSTLTWQWFWTYLAMACAFWGVRDWLLGKAPSELRHSHGASALSARLRFLLWVLAINGLLLAVEGIIQRVEGSGKLLFLVKPRVNPTAESQFGPWAYRGSAASYFNLLWPVVLGFWWTLRHSRNQGRSRHFLLVCGALMCACPLITTSRGGTVVAVAQICGAIAIFLVLAVLSRGRSSRPIRKQDVQAAAMVLFFAAVAVGLGYKFGWTQLQPRLRQDVLTEGFNVREEMNIHARPMAEDYPLFGTGPGTFEPVFQLYRKTEDTYWPAQLHNDWMETRITFGWVGSLLIAALGVSVVGRWFWPGEIHGSKRLVFFVWLAMAGCLAHARYDMPFQIYSILFLWILLCAILSVLTRGATQD